MRSLMKKRRTTNVSAPGSIYRIGGRRYVDSQAVFNLAGVHNVVPLPNGWRVLLSGGSVRCVIMEGRAELPAQRGSIYELVGEGDIDFKAHRSAWAAHSLVKAAGEFDTWPGSIVGCGCEIKAGCGCGPCRARHAHKETP